MSAISLKAYFATFSFTLPWALHSSVLYYVVGYSMHANTLLYSFVTLEIVITFIIWPLVVPDLGKPGHCPGKIVDIAYGNS